MTTHGAKPTGIIDALSGSTTVLREGTTNTPTVVVSALGQRIVLSAHADETEIRGKRKQRERRGAVTGVVLTVGQARAVRDALNVAIGEG